SSLPRLQRTSPAATGATQPPLSLVQISSLIPVSLVCAVIWRLTPLAATGPLLTTTISTGPLPKLRLPSRSNAAGPEIVTTRFGRGAAGGPPIVKRPTMNALSVVTIGGDCDPATA